MWLNGRLIVFPFLFATYPILYLYSINVEKLDFLEILPSLGGTLAITLALLVILRLILGDAARAGLLVGIFVLLFFAYGPVYDVMGDLEPVGRLFRQGVDRVLQPGEMAERNISYGNFLHVFLIAAWVLIIGASVWALARKGEKRDWHGVTRYLNAVALVLVAMPLINVGPYAVKNRAGSGSPDSAGVDEGSKGDVAEPTALQSDIYYIILDGYTREDVLEDHYNYDNGEFIDYLEDTGFYVGAESQSNYTSTLLSLASSLNMRYLDELRERAGQSGIEVLFGMIQDNAVWRELESKGYVFVHLSSGWRATNTNPQADINYQYRGLDDFQVLLLRSTVLKPVSNQIANADSRRRVLYNFEQLREVPEMEEPTFVIVHFLIPHSPYIFDANGNLTRPNLVVDNWTRKQAYVDQIQFINAQLEALIDEILVRSDTPPIIIIQGDHGWESSERWTQGDNQELIRSRVAILNAYYLPGLDDSQLYPSISPVNSFRLILDSYFGAGYGLVEDETYFSSIAERFDFVQFQPSEEEKCEGFGYGFNHARDRVLEWKESHGERANIVVAPSLPSDAPYWGVGLDVVVAWSEDALLGETIADWVSRGDAIFFVDEVPNGTLPDSPFGATLEIVDTYAVPCSDAVTIRVRRMVEAGSLAAQTSS